MVVDFDRYAIPPEHGQRLERMAKGNAALCNWSESKTCKMQDFFLNVLRSAPVS